MKDKNIEEMINTLNPKYHKHLIKALIGISNHSEDLNKPINSSDGFSADLIYEMLKKAMDALNEKYIEGGVAYIEKFHPELSKKIDNAEYKLTIKANAYDKGEIDLEEFREELMRWYLLHLKAIEIHINYLKEIH